MRMLAIQEPKQVETVAAPTFAAIAALSQICEKIAVLAKAIAETDVHMAEDLEQEAALAVLEVEEPKTISYFMWRAEWAMRDYLRKEDTQTKLKEQLELQVS